MQEVLIGQRPLGGVMDKVDSVAASSLVSSATLASLIQFLVVKGTLSLEEIREIYEVARFMIEKQQAAAAPEMAAVYEAARSVIEEQLGR